MHRLTLDVANDLERIADYIGKQNPQGAVNVLEALMRKFEFLGQFPQSGDKRPDLGPDVRAVPVGNFVVVFRPEGSGVMILRVFHGAQDIHSLKQE
jgi:toxin ParE1/3/4